MAQPGTLLQPRKMRRTRLRAGGQIVLWATKTTSGKFKRKKKKTISARREQLRDTPAGQGQKGNLLGKPILSSDSRFSPGPFLSAS